MSSYTNSKPKVILTDLENESGGEEEGQPLRTSKYFKRRGTKLNRRGKVAKQHDDIDNEEDEDISLPKIRSTRRPKRSVRKPDNETAVKFEAGLKEPPVKIIDPSMAEELKERRYRSQMEQLDKEKEEGRKEDYDSEFERLTGINRKPDMDDGDGLVEVDRDQMLSDGRLALSKSEQKVQDLIKRKEIEEALFEAQATSSSSADEMDVDSINDESLKEVYESVVPKHILKQQVKDPLEEEYPMPRLKKIPAFSSALESMKTHLQDLTTVSNKNKYRILMLESQVEGLEVEEKNLRQKVADFGTGRSITQTGWGVGSLS